MEHTDFVFQFSLNVTIIPTERLERCLLESKMTYSILKKNGKNTSIGRTSQKEACMRIACIVVPKACPGSC